jgi:hypothetical protein
LSLEDKCYLAGIVVIRPGANLRIGRNGKLSIAAIGFCAGTARLRGLSSESQRPQNRSSERHDRHNAHEQIDPGRLPVERWIPPLLWFTKLSG